MSYFPVLRHSNAEIGAYSNLKEETKKAIIPIIESRRIATSNRSKWWETFKTIGTYFKKTFEDREFIYDFRQAFDFIGSPNNQLLSDKGVDLVSYCSQKFKEQGLNYIPAFHFDSADWYVEAIAKSNPDKIAVRIRCWSFDEALDSIIFDRVDTIINKYFDNAVKKFIIIDFFDKISNATRIESAVEVFTKLQNATPIICLSSCPANADKAKPMTFNKIAPRSDFATYLKLKQKHRSLLYSDYTVRLTPEPDEGKKIKQENTYLKVFYTTSDSYMVGKSTLIKDNGIETFVKVCNEIILSKAYNGKNFSDGDKAIHDGAHRKIVIKSHNKLIEYGISHHIEFTINYFRQNSLVLREV